MKALKRLTMTLSAQINSMVDQLENHEAVANMALEEIRETMMQARFQIRRVQNEQRVYEQRLTEMEQEEKRWRERALRAQSESHDKALECVRRLKKTTDEITALKQQILHHGTLEEQLTVDVKRIESKFEELKRKRNLLAARQSRSEALAAVTEHGGSEDVGHIFERWEQKVLRGEVASEDSAVEADAFSQEFVRAEEKLELEALLQNLNESEKQSR
jgi:phage shock protein A